MAQINYMAQKAMRQRRGQLRIKPSSETFPIVSTDFAGIGQFM
jgi:hypothetical protein